jgi:hypothetical protein
MIFLILVFILILFIYLCVLLSKRESFVTFNTNTNNSKSVIDIKKTNSFKIIHKTNNFWIWEPENIVDYIGTNQYITEPNEKPQVLAILVKSKSHGNDRPKGFELISTIDDIKIWRIVPNKGHISMGNIFSKEMPSIHQYRCILKDSVIVDKLKSIEFKVNDVNIWKGMVSQAFLCIPNSITNTNDNLYKYKYGHFKIDKELKVKNVTSFIKIAEFDNISFWETEEVNDFCSIGQIAYPANKNPNDDGLMVPIIHEDFCKPINDYGIKLFSFIYNEEPYTIWRPNCYKGCGILSDIVIKGTNEPNNDGNVSSVELDYFRNIKYNRTMDWNSINSNLNNIVSIWCNSNKYFHFTEGLDKPFYLDILIDTNHILNDYDILDKNREICLSFSPNKNYNEYDSNQITYLLKKTLSKRLDIRMGRLYDINIKENSICLKIQPKLKNLTESTTREICNNIKSLIESIPIKIYNNNKLDCLLELNKMEEFYVPENIIQLDNSKSISALS